MWPTGTGAPWFRIGRIEVTTVIFVIVLAVVGWVSAVIVPQSAFAFSPDAVAAGQVWRLVTWPLAEPIGLMSALNLFFFYVFGTELENQIGRNSMARFLLGLALVLMVVTTLVWLVGRAPVALGGVWMIEFLVFLTWIADNPRRPLFFGIPAWAFGALLLGIDVLTALAGRNLWGLVTLLVSIAGAALLARANGLLTGLAWLPGGHRGARRPAASRPGRAQRAAARQESRRASDREKLDDLLDRINEKGINSLTEAERKQLMDLRNRLRGGR